MTNKLEKLRVLHIMAFKDMSDGIRSQLLNELKSAVSITGLQWEILVLTDKKPIFSFERQVPRIFRYIFLRELFLWLIILISQKKYDFILMRHSISDIAGFFFSPFVGNRITIHHTKELNELNVLRKGLIGKILIFIEKYITVISLRFCLGIIGVTNEIAEYEMQRIGKSKSYTTYFNGVSDLKYSNLKEKRIRNELRFAFMCSRFYDWHGLDILYESILKDYNIYCSQSIKIYLIGKISNKDLEIINSSEKLRRIFIICGTLKGNQLTEILDLCDGGISSLGLGKISLSQSCSLKTREYLSFGLPVLSSQFDCALSKQFDYYSVVNKQNITSSFLNHIRFKTISRKEVAIASFKYISKRNSIEKLFKWLRSLDDKYKA